jgi:hypothetical protein
MAFLRPLTANLTPHPALRSALSDQSGPQHANSCVSKRQIKHVCIDAQACGHVAEIAGMVNIVGANVGANFL